MRHTYIPQLKLGTVPVEEIEFDPGSRHELVSILMALQYLYMHREERLKEILRLIELDLVTCENRNRGCTGMSCWEALVLISVRLGCDMDYDELADLATNHRKLQQMLLISAWDGKEYKRSTINDNIRLLTAGTIRTISDVIVELGHELSLDPLKKVRGDTFVLKKNIHYPTDCNLLYDGVRSVIRLCVELGREFGLDGWREHESLKKKIRKTKRDIERVARSRVKGREEELKGLYVIMMEKGAGMVDKALDTLAALDRKVECSSLLGKWRDCVSEIHHFIAGIEYVSELARRRILEGETIPNPEKVFSLFELDTELINRGKTPYPIEFGHRVLIVQDDAGFIIGTQVLEKGFTDEKIIVEVMRNLQKRYNNRIRAASFDKGFWTPNNLKKLSEFIPLVVLPKKGKRSEVDSLREGAREFGKVRKWHSGVESAIHGLVSGNGLGVCRDKGVDGYNRYVSMAILGRNLHTLGNIVKEKARKKKKKNNDPLLSLIL